MHNSLSNTKKSSTTLKWMTYCILSMVTFKQVISAAMEMLLRLPSLLHKLVLKSKLPKASLGGTVQLKHDRTMEDFLREATRLFEAPLQPAALLAMSSRLQMQFRKRLQQSDICMLPSYNHTLPSGDEKGTYLALDVGGSTLRVALVELRGKSDTDNPMRILKMQSWKIGGLVKALKGDAFFNWIAVRIEEMLGTDSQKYAHEDAPLPMGLAWSFPVEQTSIRSGTLLDMGKGFHAAHGVRGKDLGELIMNACRRRNMNVRMDAIVNDSSATLLSRAYLDPSTRFALILGTGCNAAIHLPVTALGPSKFGIRPCSWHEKATHVLVNTELSMFGKDIFPVTRWDELLNSTHALPDFQPFEMLLSGRYLGEIVRLMLVEAIQTAGLFGGEIPENFTEPYSLDTGTIAAIEAYAPSSRLPEDDMSNSNSDDSPHYDQALQTFLTHHPLASSGPTADELHFIREIITLVSRRAAAYLATAIHALWALRLSAEGESPRTASRVSIGCNGSVVEKYPGFSASAQNWLDILTHKSGASCPGGRAVVLEKARESAIFGAAVAVAVV